MDTNHAWMIKNFSDLADDQLVPSAVTAHIINLAPGTLANHYCNGTIDLASVKIGRRRKNRVGDIRDYIKRHRTEG